MKKNITAYIIYLASTFIAFTPVKAVPVESPVSEKYGDLTGIINSFSDWLRPLGIVALLAVIAYGGYVKLTSAGDPEKDKKAALIIRSGLIGFIIIVIGPLLIDTIGAILGIDLLSTG